MKRIILSSTALFIILILHAQGDRTGGGKQSSDQANAKSAGHSASSTFDCCRKIKRKNNGNLPAVNILIGSDGKPAPPVRFVPFGAQVNVMARNVNPFAELPKTSIAFQTFNETTPGSIGEPTKSGAPAPAPEPTKSEVADLAKEAAIAKEIKDTYSALNTLITRDINLTSALTDDLSILKSSAEKNINTLTSNDAQKDNKEALAKAQRSLNELITKVMELQESNDDLKEKLKKKDEELKQLFEKFESLQEKIASRSAFTKSYDAFVESLNKLNAYLGMEASFNALFRQQWVDSAFVKGKINEIVSARLPGVNASLSNTGVSNKQLLDGCYSVMFSEAGRMEEVYQALNKMPVSDTFKTAKPTEIELTGPEGKKAKMKVPVIEVGIEQKPVFEEQMKFVREKMKYFKNDSIRRAMYVYTDTLLQKMSQVYADSFYRPIKTFQAMADEIKVTLPHKQAEALTLNTYCKLKVQGSTGVFVHFGVADDKVVMDKDSAGNSIVVKQKPESVLFSFGLLAHFYKYDPRKDFNLGGSIGLNVPINNQGGTGFLQLAGGISAHSTTVDKLIITLGLSVRKGQQLNTENLTKAGNENIYKFNNVNATQPVMDAVTRVGVFLGFSYSIFGNSKSTQAE